MGMYVAHATRPINEMRLPFLTSSLCVAALAVNLLGLADMTQLSRSGLALGEYYRVFTCHLAHFTTNHCCWDVAMFAVLGAVCEILNRRRFLVTIGLAAALIALGVLLLMPGLQTYRGLSGLDSALFGMLIGYFASKKGETANGVQLAAWALAILFVAKVAIEIVTGTTIFVEHNASFTPAPLAHLIGVIIGFGVNFFPRMRTEQISRALVVSEAA